MNLRALLACIALLAMNGTALAQARDELPGTWAMQVGNRNLVVLKLEGAPSQLEGTLQRPMGVAFGPTTPAGTRVSQVKMPLFSVQVKELRSSPSGRVFALQFESNAAGEILLRPDGRGGLLLGFSAEAPEASLLPLVRAADTAEVATDWEPEVTYLVRAPLEPPNAEMAALHAADQADRQGAWGSIGWSVVTPRDEARRLRVRQLLDAGQLRTAEDYYNAAFVFQHGTQADDHLLAHVLAMAAMTLGRNDASWIASATLDRYLQNTERSQIFGTQYVGQVGTEMTQGRYDSALIPDSLRRVFGVPTLQQQEAQLKQMNSGQ